MKQEPDNFSEKRAAEVQEAAEEVMETLDDYPMSIWGDVLAAVTSTIFAAKIDAAEIEREEAAKRAILNLTEENPFSSPPPLPRQWIDGNFNVIPFGDHSGAEEG